MRRTGVEGRHNFIVTLKSIRTFREVLAPFADQRDQGLLRKSKAIIPKEEMCFPSFPPSSLEHADNGTVSFLDMGHFVL